MGIWDRVRRAGEMALSPRGRSTSGAAILEDEGRLTEAAAAYEAAGEHVQAIRVMLALADEEPDARARVRLLSRAARIGAGVVETPRELRVRYALARLDLAMGSPSGRLPSELSALGRELAAEGEHGPAAEAFRLAGDARGAAASLAEAGEIERLEGVLESENDRARQGHRRSLGRSEIESLEASGQRLLAIDRASALASAGDQELGLVATRISAALLRGPSVTIEEDGVTTRWILGDEVVLGRVDAGVVVPSPLVSRRHLRFHRHQEIPRVEDLHTSNGTFLKGARLAGAISLTTSLTLSLGREIDIAVSPAASGGITLDVAGASYRLPLGPARVGPWLLVESPRGVRLEVPPGAPAPLLGGTVAAAEGVDLSIGDTIAASRDGAWKIVVRA